jgi:CRISPR/Cas system-associated protein Cas10 (large subunit of type III CRISPR-Cas system)
MGKWVSGEKTPPYRDQLADYKDAQSRTDKGAVEYFTRINATEFLNTQRLLTPSYHLQFSESLSNFALHIAPRIVRAHKGRLIYAGGDDVLAMLPASNALACAHDLQMAFSGKAPMKECGIRELSPGFLAIDHRSGRDQLGKLIPFIVPGPRATASVGIAMAHFKAPLQDVVRAAQAAEKRAKKHCPEKNAFAVSVFKHSGEISEWDGTFRNAAALAAFSDLLRLMNEEVLSSKFPHKFLELIEPYRSTGSIQDCADFNFTEAVKHDLDLVIERQRGPDYTAKSGGEIRATMNAYLKTLTGSPTERHRQLSGLLTVAAFLARQPQ